MKCLIRVSLVIACLNLVQCRTNIRNEIGVQAYKWTSELTDIGPRTPGTLGSQKARDWIETKVKSFGLRLERFPFMALTPFSWLPMQNILYRVPGAQHNGNMVLLAHYDSKFFKDKIFVGANDAASSVALLLAMTPSIQKMNLPYDVIIVFVDGEEALVDWSANDSLYGSRQMLQTLKSHFMPIKGVVVVDMVGDKDLSFIRSRGNDEKLFSYFEQSLKGMNESEKLDTQPSYVQDDHTPFMEAGMPILHVMDFTYGGKETPGIFWHTADDTIKNISADSLAITGEALLRVLKKIN